MLKGKTLWEYTNLFSPNDYENNIKKIFLRNKKMKKLYCVICGNYRKSEKPKMLYLSGKTLVLSIIYSKCKNEDEKLFEEEESIEISKILGLIENI